MMFTHGCSKPKVSFNLLSLINIQDVSLFCADEELLRAGVYVIFHRSTSQDFDNFVTVTIIEVMSKLMLLNRSIWLTHIPPEYKSVCGSRDALLTDFTRTEPVNIVDGVMMRIF